MDEMDAVPEDAFLGAVPYLAEKPLTRFACKALAGNLHELDLTCCSRRAVLRPSAVYAATGGLPCEA